MARGVLLLKRPSPFAFPGGNPGFDPSHVAARGITKGNGLSCVAVGNGTFINLLDAKSGTIVGTVSSVVDGTMGRVCDNGNAGGHVFATASTVDSSVGNTMAVIFSLKGAGSLGVLLAATLGGSGKFNLGMNPSNLWMLQGGTQTDTSGANLALGVPYFGAVAANSSTVNFVVSRLDTGQVVSQTTYSAPGTVSSAIDAHFPMNGSAGGVAFQINGRMAAAMHSPTYLSQTQLLQWALDPWSFWYQ